MSAYLVPKGTIDTLVQAVIDYLGSLPGTPDEVGTMLWDENCKSLDARYPGSAPHEHEPYTFEGTDNALHPAAIYKQCSCYDYQSCEHAGWESSAAHTLVHEIMQAVAFEAIPEEINGVRIPWGVEKISQATELYFESGGEPPFTPVALCKYCLEVIDANGVDRTGGDGCSGDTDGANENQPHVPDRGKDPDLVKVADSEYEFTLMATFRASNLEEAREMFAEWILEPRNLDGAAIVSRFEPPFEPPVGYMVSADEPAVKFWTPDEDDPLDPDD